MEYFGSKFNATIEYCGGLGNQLFQIFTLLSYSIDTGKNATLVYSDKSPSVTTRPTYWSTIFSEFKNFSNTNTGIKIQEMSGFIYHPIPDVINNVILSGYYQSYKYFSNNFNSICDTLRIRDKQASIQTEFSESYLKRDYSSQKIVSVHFRLGDYKRLQQYHPILPLIYYSNSLKFINNAIGDSIKILCFCEKEDVETVSNVVSGLELANYQIVSSDIEDWQQMFLMSLCDWNIIANSTFSWWGAMFNKNQENIIYPSNWFHTKTPVDLIPRTWKMVSF